MIRIIAVDDDLFKINDETGQTFVLEKNDDDECEWVEIKNRSEGQ